MTFIYMPYDLFFKPVAEDEEVWFGFVLHGWEAKLTAPLHWLIYGAGAYGFWKMARWMWPFAALYTTQIAIAMLVWNLIDERGGDGARALFRRQSSRCQRLRCGWRRGVSKPQATLAPVVLLDLCGHALHREVAESLIPRPFVEHQDILCNCLLPNVRDARR